MINIKKLFKKDNRYKGNNVDLVEKYRTNEKTAYDGVPTIYYEIQRHSDKTRVGSIELRMSIEGYQYYYGHIGYNVIQKYRGNNYAYWACKLLFEIAYEQFDMHELIITCSPENIASYKTLLRLNGQLIEKVDVPKEHMLYILGEKTKLVFKYDLDLS